MKKSLIIGVVAIVVVLGFVFLSEEGEKIPDDVNFLESEILEYSKNYLQDFGPIADDSGRYLRFSIVSKKNNKAYHFVEEDLISGTAGTVGHVISTNLNGDFISVVTRFVNTKEEDVSLNNSEDYLLFTSLTGNSSCLRRSIDLIKTNDDTLISLEIPESEKGQVVNQQNLKDGYAFISAEWVDDYTVEINTPLEICHSENLLLQTWQYNVETGEYTLISEQNE